MATEAYLGIRFSNKHTNINFADLKSRTSEKSPPTRRSAS